MKVGTRVRTTVKYLEHMKNARIHIGYVVGHCQSNEVIRVKWDDRKSFVTIHKSFVEPINIV